jgi:Ca2+-binding EF-hand superfamily protein
MEDKVFNGKVKLFQVFRQFDKDKDGYISYDDFGQCLESIKVHADQKEVSSMLKLIDKDNQGYLTFTQFQHIFSPSMSDNLVNIPKNDVYHPNLHPSKA